MIKNKETFDPGEENMAEKFAGNALTCTNTLVFLAFEAFLIVLLSSGRKADASRDLIILIGGTLFMYLFMGFQMFYFKVSPRYIIVKNHYLPWINWHYKLEDISKLSISSNPRMSKCLAMTIKSHRFGKMFPAGSLRQDHWWVLQKRLGQAGFMVNERLF